MSVRDKVHIKITNESGSTVCVTGRNREYVFMGSYETEEYSFELMSFEEIEYINSKSPVFRTGLLRFPKEDEDEIFNELGYPNWKDMIITEEDIDTFIFHPTAETQKRIISIKDMHTIERIRGKVMMYSSMGKNGISARTMQLVNDRYTELCNNIWASKLIPSADVEDDKHSLEDKLEILEKQNAKLNSQLSTIMDFIAKSGLTPAPDEPKKAAPKKTKNKTEE